MVARGVASPFFPFKPEIIMMGALQRVPKARAWRGVWACPPRTFWNLEARKCYFQHFPQNISSKNQSRSSVKWQVFLVLIQQYNITRFAWTKLFQSFRPPSLLSLEHNHWAFFHTYCLESHDFIFQNRSVDKGGDSYWIVNKETVE